jgi:integrase
VGLKYKLNPGGSGTFFYQQWNGRLKRPVKYTIGQFPEWKVERARSLIDKLKEGIKLGQDPKSIIELNRLIPTLNEVIDLWKTNIMNVSNSYRDSTKEDVVNRFRVWIGLSPMKNTNLQLQKYINANRAALNIGNKQIHSITKTDVLKWFKLVTVRGPHQANRIIDDLKIVVKWAIENKSWRIEDNFAKLTISELNPRVKRINKYAPYTQVEVSKIRKRIVKKAFLQSDGVKYYPRNFASLMGILMAVFQGRRYQDELLSLPWSRVDVEQVTLARTKNEEGATTFKLNRQTQWIMRKMKQYGKDKFKETRQIRFKKFVFPSMRKSKVGHCYNVDKTFKTICNEEKIRVLPVYMLRHTWAANALAAGVSMKDLKDEGGWKTWSMVEEYAKADDKRRKNTSQTIATFLATGKR